MMEVTFGRVVDDVFEADIDGRAAELHRKDLIGFVAQTIKKQGVNRRGLLTDESGKGGPLSAVSFARRAQAAKEIDLKLGCFRQLIGRELGAALIEIVSDTHRADGVRTRW